MHIRNFTEFSNVQYIFDTNVHHNFTLLFYIQKAFDTSVQFIKLIVHPIVHLTANNIPFLTFNVFQWN